MADWKLLGSSSKGIDGAAVLSVERMTMRMLEEREVESFILDW